MIIGMFVLWVVFILWNEFLKIKVFGVFVFKSWWVFWKIFGFGFVCLIFFVEIIFIKWFWILVWFNNILIVGWMLFEVINWGIFWLFKKLRNFIIFGFKGMLLDWNFCKVLL